jgi:hypothetical protein
MDFAHIPMVHGRYVTVVPGDRDCIPASRADGPAIRGVPLPINAGAFSQSLGFRGSHAFGVLAFEIGLSPPIGCWQQPLRARIFPCRESRW